MKGQLQRILAIIFGVIMIVSFTGGFLINLIPANQDSSNSSSSVSLSVGEEQVATSERPLEVTDIQEGEGEAVTAGDLVRVNYTGTLTDGTVFDSSLNEGREPFEFVVGQGTVIRGWDQGLVGMKEGGQRRLTIPPSLGYGTRGSGPIPPNSTLVFDIELLEINPEIEVQTENNN
jgi:FKBP-type peptidyl-prolyl cis-trans isomerase